MSELDVYLWLKLDAVIAFFTAVSVLGSATLAILLFIGISIKIDYSDPEYNRHQLGVDLLKKAKILFMFLLISIIGWVITPSTKQFAAIKVFPKITNSQIAQQLPDDLADMYAMAKEYMKEMIQKEPE